MQSAESSGLPCFISKQVLRGRYVFVDLRGGRDNLACRIACAGCEECAADYRIKRDTFHYHAIEYIAGGEWELVSGGVRQILRPGTIFAYGPGVAYSLRPLATTGLKKYFIDFHESAAKSLRRAGLARGGSVVLSERRWLQDLFDQLIDTADLPLSLRRRIGDALGRLILERICIDKRQPKAVTHSRSTYERCRDIIAGHYLDIRSLEEAARRCNLTPVHLCRLFRRFAFETPYGLLTRLKMNHAAGRIVRSGLPVKTAAGEVGYADPYHFSRVFKKTHGVAPSRFAQARGA